MTKDKEAAIFRFLSQFLWPIRIFSLFLLAQVAGHLLDLILGIGLLGAVGLCFFLIYYYADKYEQKNIKIYLENQEKRKTNYKPK